MSPEMISLKRAGFSVLSIVTFYPVLLTRHLTSLCYFSMPTFIKFPGGNGHHIDLHSTFGIKKLDSGTPAQELIVLTQYWHVTDTNGLTVYCTWHSLLC